jgi:hypothetical protein
MPEPPPHPPPTVKDREMRENSRGMIRNQREREAKEIRRKKKQRECEKRKIKKEIDYVFLEIVISELHCPYY